MGSIKTEDLRQRGHIAVVIHRFRGLDEQIFSSIFHDPSQNEDRRIHSPWITVAFDSWNSSNLDGSRLVPFSMEE